MDVIDTFSVNSIAILLIACLSDVGFAKERRFGFFWHVTDIHLDTEYTVFGDKSQECHSSGDTTQEVPAENAPGHFGEYKCDSPRTLVASALAAMLWKGGGTPDFILWTGNNRRVDDSTNSMANLMEAIHVVYAEMSQQIPDMRQYPVLGRNDFYPRGRHTASSDLTYDSPIYKNLSFLFRFWMEDPLREQFELTGYYSRRQNTQTLRIIVLNTNLFVEDHVASLQNDPGGQWSWLEGELKEVRKLGQKAYLVMSTPPGVFEKAYHVPGVHYFRSKHNRIYIKLVRAYRDVIFGQFAGQHHAGTFRVFYSKREEPLSWMFIAPSVAPRNMDLAPHLVTYNNPGIRLYMYDQETSEILDYTQYYLNLSEANRERKALWDVAYTFSTYYSVPNVSIYSLQLLMSRLQDDPVMFKRYYEASSLFMNKVEDCDKVCKRYHVCAVANIDYPSFYECVSAADATDPHHEWGKHISDDWEPDDGDDGPMTRGLPAFMLTTVALFTRFCHS